MRFLFYLAVFYLIYKLIRMVLNSKVTINNFNYNDQREPKNQEGEVHIKKDPSKGERSGNSLDGAGEYVDYEEVDDK